MADKYRPTGKVLLEGPAAVLVAAEDSRGKLPVEEFLLGLSKTRPIDFKKIQALLRIAVEIGPRAIRNNERIRTLGGGFYEFKSFQVRIYWVYDTKFDRRDACLLLDGVIKKKNKHRPEDIARAKRILQDFRKKQRHE